MALDPLPHRRRLAIIERRAGGEVLRFLDHCFIGKARRTRSGLGIGLRCGKQLVHRGADPADTRDEGFHVAFILDHMLGEEEGRQARLPRTHLVEDIGLVAELPVPFGLREIVFPHVVGNLRGRRQIVIVEVRFHLGGCGAHPFELFELRFFGELVDLVVIGFPSECGLRHRAESQLFLELFIEPLVEALGLRGGAFDGGDTGHGGIASGERNRRSGGEQQARELRFHGIPLRQK